MPMSTATQTFVDLSSDELIAHSLANKEVERCANGAVNVKTGKRTGRSPKDRFIVKDALTEKTVDWGTVNQPIDPAVFRTLWQRAEEYLSKRPAYISHLRVGADEKDFIPVKVMTELACHNLFAQCLFIRSQEDYSKNKASWTLISVPGLTTHGQADGVNSDGCVMMNMSERQVLLIGMHYMGEMKKAMFTVMNFFSTDQDVLPMHCAANRGKSGDVALFFGLSGTGKTTLSADPERYLIGDDEHGWNKTGVFNFEGGCYAKCIDLSHEREPVIWEAIKNGAVMENVVLKSNGEPDFNDGSLTQNTRAAYPREHIPLRVLENRAGQPRSVIFLTCDLYGVLPPIALLTKEQAAYYFLSGYTALVGSTEMGSSAGIKPTFSTCFGAPFFPRPATVYAELLMKRITETGAQVYLVNTGWTGGAYGHGGERFSIPVTRSVVRAVVSGELVHQPTETLPGFHFAIPKHVPGVDSQLLNPRNTWKNPADYDKQARELMDKFIDNFKRFNVSSAIREAGPKI